MEMDTLTKIRIGKKILVAEIALVLVLFLINVRGLN